MGYRVITLLNRELELIQKSATKFRFRKNPLRNDMEIKALIDQYGVRSEADFLAEQSSEEFLEPNSFGYDDIEEIGESSITTYTSTSTSYKDRVQESVVNDFIEYEYAYRIIGVDIKPKHWNLLFDITYEVYQNNDVEDEFLDDMSRLNRFAFSLALLKNSLVNIGCYIEGLGYMKSRHLKKRDILILQERLSNETREKKVLNITDGNKKNKEKVKSSRNLSGNKIIDFNSRIDN